MSVTNEELQRAAEAIQRVPDIDDYRTALHAAEIAATVLRPEGSVLLGGTCKSCRHLSSDDDDICCHMESPAYFTQVPDHFTCALFQRKAAP